MCGNFLCIVDDDENDRYFLLRTIRRTGITNEVVTYSDGRECIAALLDETKPLPLLMFLDLKMPHTNGFEVLAWRLTQPRLCKLPIVITSGSDIEDDIQRAKNLGAHAYFTKPLTNDQVDMVVREFKDSITRK